MDEREIGRVEKTMNGIRWTIFNFFRTVKERNYSCFDSPTFSIANALWHLRLYPNWGLTTQFTQLQLIGQILSNRDYLIEYSFGLERNDGGTEQIVSGILKEDEVHNTECSFIKKSELWSQQNEFVHENALNITLTMKFMNETTHSPEQTALDATRCLVLIGLEKLSENFRNLFDDKETCDVTLKVKDKEYKAHKSVLIARSSVFAATFKHDTLERQTGIITIPDCDPDSFQEFLKYLYSGKLEELTLQSAQSLYYTSDKYDIEELKAFCVEYLVRCLTVENMCEVALFADKCEQIAIFSAVQEFFNKNLCKILATAEWECLVKKDFRLANKLMLEMSKIKHKE